MLAGASWQTMTKIRPQLVKSRMMSLRCRFSTAPVFMWGVGAPVSQAELVDHLRQQNVIRSQRVASVMREVDRRHFINPETASIRDSYQDNPLPIGGGQTISAPHMHATCLELLEPYLKPGARVLDVGSGSGYLSVCLAKMVGDTGFVLGVEKLPDLTQRSITTIKKAYPELFSSNRLKIVHGNVLADVLRDEAGFHAIHVGAAAEELPQVLVSKLLPGGRMVIPVGPRWSYQNLVAVDKAPDGKVTKHNLMNVGYVPLTRPEEDDF